MSKRKNEHPVQTIREIIGKSRPHFALMVGCSHHAIKRLETGKLKVSEKMAKQIFRATACDPGELLKGFCGESLNLNGLPYTKEWYDDYLKQIKQPKEKEWRRKGREATLGWLELLLTIADEKEKLAAVRGSLMDWMNQARDEFGLGAAIDRELKTRKTKRREEYTVTTLRRVPGLAKLVNFIDSPAFEEGDRKTFNVEYSMKWNPYSNEPPPPSQS